MKQTMKKYFIFLASAAMLLATSCAKEEVNTTGETELITVQLNPETKTALGADGTTTTWDADDKVSVTVGGEVVGTLSLVEGSTFSGEITAGLSGDATLKYPADVTAIPEPQAAVNGSFANGAALLEGTTTVEDLRAGKSVELKNKTALLKFTVAQAGEVTFEVGTAKYTVTGCKTGETYYACVEPAESVNLVARIDGYLSRATSDAVTFTASTVADLEELPAPKESSVELRGDSPLSWENGTKFYEDIDCFVLKNVPLTATQGFKIVSDSKWLQGAVTKDKWAVLKENGENMKLAAGNYDIYISKTAKVISVVSAGSSSPELIKPESDYLYLLPSDNWLESNAHFAAWIWKDSGAGKVYNFTEHKSVTGLYQLKLNGANMMILFRMDPNNKVTDGSTSYPGDDQWFKSGDLSIGTNNLYTVINWHGTGSGFSKVTTLL